MASAFSKQSWTHEDNGSMFSKLKKTISQLKSYLAKYQFNVWVE